MPFPHILGEQFHELAFWKTFFFIEEDNERVEIPEVVVDFPVGGGCHVVLDIKGQYDSYELGIRTPSSDGIRCVGWDDLANWHPYAFRWSELDLVCRAASALDPAMPHPGPAMVLLCRFASVHDDDDIDTIASTLQAAFDSLRPNGWEGAWLTFDDWLGRRDFRGRGVVWSRDESGNLYTSHDHEDDRPFYTMRGEPSDDPDAFPHDQWRALLAAAHTTLARLA